MPSMAALYAFLSKHPEIARVYRRSGHRGTAIAGYEEGFLTTSQILQIRAMTFHSKAESRFARAGRPRSALRGNSPLKYIYDKAIGNGQ